MHGTLLQRLARVPLALLRRPQDFPRYLAQTPWAKRSPLDLQVPWFSYAAIDFINNAIKPTDRVCELGGGGSTLWFAKRAASVVTLESDPEWARRIRSAVPTALSHKVNIIESALPPPYDDFTAEPYLAPLKGMCFDWIVLDFMDDEFDRRPVALRWLEQHVLSTGGALIVDDAWRYPQIYRESPAKSRRQFCSTGPARYGVTQTDIHFYHADPAARA